MPRLTKFLLVTFLYQVCYHYTIHFYSRYCSNVFTTYRLFTNERKSISYSKIYTYTVISHMMPAFSVPINIIMNLTAGIPFLFISLSKG